ncbi:UNVERIFIED_CONTAM: hypothetical protein GTU68_025096 [Idotea baltica]|nr:hypothetical protein [Idotea baltica]
MIHRRLSWWMESNSLHLEEPCGFRSGRGVMDVLLQLEHKAQMTYRNKGIALASFLDIKSAFDKSSHLGILYKISCMGLHGTPLQWLQSFLENRSYSVSVGASLSTPSPIRTGLPQGSVLSPPLFSVLLSDFSCLPHVSTFLYADDISL